MNPSWWAHSGISRSSQYSMTGITKVMVCAILSGMVHIKAIAANRKGPMWQQ